MKHTVMKLNTSDSENKNIVTVNFKDCQPKFT